MPTNTAPVRKTYIHTTLNVTKVEITHFANRIYYAVQYCVTLSCTSGSLTAIYTEAYVRRNNKQLCNRLKFLFQPSIVFVLSKV